MFFSSKNNHFGFEAGICSNYHHLLDYYRPRFRRHLPAKTIRLRVSKSASASPLKITRERKASKKCSIVSTSGDIPMSSP